MLDSCYRPGEELDECNRLMEAYFQTGQYEACFQGHPAVDKALLWTRRAAEHGDRDAQYNLADCFYWPGLVVEMDVEEAGAWYRRAAEQGHPEARIKCQALGIEWEEL